jgi:hypothetical protein
MGKKHDILLKKITRKGIKAKMGWGMSQVVDC